jgi:hypothetical protein
MKTLKSLTFAALTSAYQDPQLKRRVKLVAQLERQKALALDPLYVRTEYKWRINANGIKERVEEKRRIRPWWRMDGQGAVYLTIRCGPQALEFEKGRAAVLVPSKDELAATIDILIAAVQAGELDTHLAQYAKARSGSRAKRAA